MTYMVEDELPQLSAKLLVTVILTVVKTQIDLTDTHNVPPSTATFAKTMTAFNHKELVWHLRYLLRYNVEFP